MDDTKIKPSQKERDEYCYHIALDCEVDSDGNMSVPRECISYINRYFCEVVHELAPTPPNIRLVGELYKGCNPNHARVSKKARERILFYREHLKVLSDNLSDNFRERKIRDRIRQSQARHISEMFFVLSETARKLSDKIDDPVDAINALAKIATVAEAMYKNDIARQQANEAQTGDSTDADGGETADGADTATENFLDFAEKTESADKAR